MPKTTAKRLKIFFDASPLLTQRTGVAHYIERLITTLAAEYPNRIELVGFYYNFLGRKNHHHLPEAPNIRYRPIRLLPSKIIYQLRRFGLEFPLELLVKERGDFVLYGNFLGYPSLYHTPAAPVIHDLTYIDLPEYVAAKNRADLKRFVPKQIERSTFIITVSQFSKDKIIKEYGVDDSDILVTAIPPATSIITKDASQTVASLGISKRYILALGTIEPRKNITTLINAYTALSAKTRKRYSLVVAGRIGWNCEAEVQALKSAADQGIDIIHLGYVSDRQRQALYQCASLYVSTSHYEGFGMPLLEAMSYGIPCAVSDIPVFHEVAADSCLYLNKDSFMDVARTIEHLLQDEPLQADLKKRMTVRLKHFSWPKIAKEVLKKIESNIT